MTGIVQVQTKNTLPRSDMRWAFCQGALVTACAVLWRLRNCRIHHHHALSYKLPQSIYYI